MRLLPLLEDKRKCGAIWYEFLRQSPKAISVKTHTIPALPLVAKLPPFSIPRAAAAVAGLLLGVAQLVASVAESNESAVACRTDRDCVGYYRCLGGACTVPPAVLGRSNARTPTVELLSGGMSRGRFYIELARDRFARGRGLSHRPYMADGWGMLFVFPEMVRNAFTMELMRFPLDMIFVGDDGRVVDMIEGAQPKGRRFVSSSDYRYVVELNAGAVRTHGIEVGDSLQLNGASLH